MVAREFNVDLNKPLVFQVGHLGEAYQEWVHQPIASKEGPRLFESDYCELLTRTPWWVIPLIWLPIACWFISGSVQVGLTLPQIVVMVVFGMFVWTLMEYTLHRFLFHINTKSYWGNTAHYLLHGCHHKHPMDGLRLVFPPAAAAVLSILFWNMVKLLSTPSTAPALFGGILVGYVIYDCTHYYLHHGQPTKEIAKDLKARTLHQMLYTGSLVDAFICYTDCVIFVQSWPYILHLKKQHLNHHFRIQNKGFGITSSMWDKVFGTLPQTNATQESR